MLSGRQKANDEENSLCVETTNYGTIPPPSSDESSSRGNSDADERASNHSSSIVKRKKRRMEQRQCCKPKLSARLSILPKRNGSSSCDEDERPTDLVLPALDPKAKEVIESIPTNRSLDGLFMRQSHVNLSTVRANYRYERRKARHDTQKRSFTERMQHFFMYNPHIAFMKSLLFAKKTIILFVNLDLLVDLIFCIAYLVEMKEEADVNLYPPWLYKYRSYDLWLVCLALTYWDLCSFAIRK
ncbi:uncharacterized protein EV154DRAFT_329253 [Mucor mucedo]|uniref:uncharacterized protein n=1 Tax=Mucor mucedo TaxID=29922 RepID=UPI002220B3CA|nr:uncharacterized protein EV154DRAFT_329253 [Mucor mucedo]KAI7887810.1 hypothetical protein EV154DRAFT_329253 [Mucor mucedo]